MPNNLLVLMAIIHPSRNYIYIKLLVPLFLSLSVMADNQTVPPYSIWDASLPELVLSHVDTTTDSLRAQSLERALHSAHRTGTLEQIAELEVRLSEIDSMPASILEVWQKFSMDYGIRSILFIDSSIDFAKPLIFQCEECLVHDLFDAFAETYGLAWQADPITSVHWFYPATMQYEDILSDEIYIDSDYYGLPMAVGWINALNVELYRHNERSLIFRYDDFLVLSCIN